MITFRTLWIHVHVRKNYTQGFCWLTYFLILKRLLTTTSSLILVLVVVLTKEEGAVFIVLVAVMGLSVSVVILYP